MSLLFGVVLGVAITLWILIRLRIWNEANQVHFRLPHSTRLPLSQTRKRRQHLLHYTTISSKGRLHHQNDRSFR